MDFEQPMAGSIDIGTGPLEPDPYIMETGKVDLGVYYTKDRCEAEKEIFGRVWLNVSEAAEIHNPGYSVVRAIAVRTSTLVIVRGKDNQKIGKSSYRQRVYQSVSRRVSTVSLKHNILTITNGNSNVQDDDT